MKKTTVILAMTAITLFLAAQAVMALSLEPLSQVFDTNPNGRVRTFRVSNTQNSRIAVRVLLTTRDILPTGEEVREPADDVWTVFPRQITLEPGATQAVRVQYTGPAGIETEQAFRIIAEQLPVDFTDGQDDRSGIKMLFRYEGSVYVRPPRAAADIRLTESSRRFAEDEFEGVLLRFENRGTAHAVLNDLRVELVRRDEQGVELGRIELAGDDLPVAGGANLLAGRSLEEIVELPTEWSQGQLEVQYDVDLVE